MALQTHPLLFTCRLDSEWQSCWSCCKKGLSEVG